MLGMNLKKKKKSDIHSVGSWLHSFASGHSSFLFKRLKNHVVKDFIPLLEFR